MSVTLQSRELLLRVQLDSEGRILSHAYFSDVATILERKALTTAEISKQLGAVKGRSGKVGVAVLIQRPTFFPESDNAEARGQVIQVFTVLEHPTLNRGSTGTGKSAEEIALELFMLFHGVDASIPQQVFTGTPDGAVVPDDSFPGINAYAVRMQLFTSPQRDPRCGLPLISPDEGAAPQTVTLTCATAGASIYYTTDGSTPCSGNPAATLYATPISIASACTLRVGAEKSGLQASGISEANFT